MIYLDTNVVVWLAAGAHEQLSPTAVETLESASGFLISPMVELEIEYLYEVGRIQQPASTVLDHLSGPLGLARCDRPFGEVVTAARGIKWTRDPFDRLITAQAALNNATLLTRDKLIRANYPRARW